MLHKALQNKWVRVLIAVFATFLYALGVNLFIVPMGLYSGGVVGLSQVIRTLLMQHLDLPAGVDIAGILYFPYHLNLLSLNAITYFQTEWKRIFLQSLFIADKAVMYFIFFFGNKRKFHVACKSMLGKCIRNPFIAIFIFPYASDNRE